MPEPRNTTSQHVARMWFGLIVLGLIVLTSCKQAKQEQPATPPYTFSEGALRVEIALSSDAIRTSDLLHLDLAAHGPADVDVVLPEPFDCLGKFTVLESREDPLCREPDGTVSKLRRLVLEPGLPGSYSIPPMTVSLYRDRRTIVELSTDPIEVTVASVIPEGDTALRDIEPDIVENKSASPLKLTLAGLLTAAGVGMLLFVLKRRKKPEPRAPLEIAGEKLKLLNTSNPDHALNELKIIIFEGLTARYLLPPHIVSTEVVLGQLEKQSLQPAVLQSISEVLDTYDSLRFSRDTPSCEKVELLKDSVSEMFDLCSRERVQ